MPAWLAALVKGFVEGIVQPLLTAWQQYQHGRSAQQADDARGSLTQQQEVDDAAARARRDAPDVIPDRLLDGPDPRPSIRGGLPGPDAGDHR